MIGLILLLLRGYELLIFARVILSWVQADPSQPLVAWIIRLTEPVLDPIRRLLPTTRIGIDFSALIVILILEFVQRTVIRLPMF